MNYRTLFTDECEASPIARHSDPITSHESAARIESTRSETQRRCLEVLKQSNVPLCANSLATACCKQYGCEGNDQQKHKIWENYRKRSHEIFRNAELTEECGKLDGSRTFKARASK